MAALPPIDNEAALRALDLKCESPSSSDSARTVVQLGKLPLATRKLYLYNSIVWDLPHLVRCLLQELSADTRFGGEWNETALSRCAIEGSARSLKVLLAGGASHALADNGGTRPLSEAARRGHLDCLRILLEAGADARAADLLGHTPLIGAVMHKRVECARALLPVSDLQHYAKDGQTVLHISVQTASEECFELLLPLMDPDVRTVQGVEADGTLISLFQQTPLHIGCGKGQMAMARALLKRGADRMALDSTQSSPLHWAAVAGALSCVIALVGRPEKPLLTSEQVNAKTVDGMTALHLAAYFGHEKICGVILSLGARLSLGAKDSIGNTPLMLAQEKHPDKASLLTLLSGNGPANLPGTVCDHCGKPAGRRMLACGVCQSVRYCDSACQLAVWPGHKKECAAEQAVREKRTQFGEVSLKGGANAA